MYNIPSGSSAGCWFLRLSYCNSMNVMNCQCLLLIVCVQFCNTADCTWDTTGKLFLSFARLSLCHACYFSQAHLDYCPPHINPLSLIGNSWQSMLIAAVISIVEEKEHYTLLINNAAAVYLLLWRTVCKSGLVLILVHWTVLFKMRTQINSELDNFLLYYMGWVYYLSSLHFCLTAWNGK